MSQSDMARHGGCRRQHKACMSQGNVAGHGGHVARHGGCRRQHKACMSQGNVARHGGAEGNTKLVCRGAMWLGTMVPEATQNLHVAKQCGWARGVLKATQSLHVARRCG
ncbi:unnamed protein product [Prunus armeniaca]